MSKSIYAKILAVMEAIDSIEKRGRNTQQNYRYFMAEDLFNDVREEFIKHKLVVIPACTGQDVIEGQTKSGGNQYITKAHLQYTLCDVETGETVTFSWEGQGQDSGDKGIWKAFTGAGKYWLKNLLLLPAEDDPENDGTKPGQKRAARAEETKQQSTVALAGDIRVKAIIDHFPKRDGGWRATWEVLTEKGLPELKGMDKPKQQEIIKEYLHKLTAVEADKLLVHLGTLPALATKPKTEGAQ